MGIDGGPGCIGTYRPILPNPPGCGVGVCVDVDKIELSITAGVMLSTESLKPAADLGTITRDAKIDRFHVALVGMMPDDLG